MTKELLLDAAVAEFAEYGLAGARIDRIAERSGVNKRLLYAYFGNKDALFDTVVERHAAQLSAAVPLDPADLGDYAGRVFDYLVEHPDTLRLVTWRDFEGREPTAVEERAYAAKLRELRAAQKAGTVNAELNALDLLALLQRLPTSWLAAPVGLKAAAGKDPMATRRLNQHRAALVEAVRRIAAPG